VRLQGDSAIIKLSSSKGLKFKEKKSGPDVGGEVAQIMYTHVSKCKNDKNKIKK
jgi:hypothetical protein